MNQAPASLSPLMGLSLSVRNRLEKIAGTKSNGVPEQYNNPFEWAADWVADNGMTLPPDTNDYRSLRNWFCFKLNQWKKGRLGEKNEAMLALHGLDFSQYQALKVGKVTREPDGPYVQLLQNWKSERGTYDLDNTADGKLITWQARLISRFAFDGPSLRMKDIQKKLPDLHYGLWRGPADAQWSTEIRHWWQDAALFELESAKCPAFRGDLHPDTAKTMREWATDQQALLKSGSLSGRRRGWMIGFGLAVNRTRLRVSSEREKALIAIRGGDDAIAAYGRTDRRMGSILGALLVLRLLLRKASDREICTEMQVTPAVVVAIRKSVGNIHDQFKAESIKTPLSACRLIYLADRTAFTPGFWRRVNANQGQGRPLALDQQAEAMGRLAYKLACEFRTKTD